MADTGNGAVVSFGTTSFTGDIISITGLEVSKEKIEITKLEHTGRKRFITDDLVDIGDITISAYSDVGVPNIDYDYGSPIDEDITITYPVAPGGTAGATVVFAGRPVSVKTADAEMGEVMVVEIVIAATNNKIDWAFTAGS